MAFATIEQVGNPSHVETKQAMEERQEAERQAKRDEIESGFKKLREQNSGKPG